MYFLLPLCQIIYCKLFRSLNNWIVLCKYFLVFFLLQDIRTRETIRCGTKKRGLYYVDDVALRYVNQVRSGDSNKIKTILLWHRRLGYGNLRKVLLSLFSNVSNSTLKYSDWILAKIYRASYQLSFNKRIVSFELIHSNMRGSSPGTTQHGIHWFIIFVDDCNRITLISI